MSKSVHEIIAEIEAGLKKTTKGVWQIYGASKDGWGVHSGYFDDQRRICTSLIAGSQSNKANAQHIANCNPQNIKAILDSHKALVEALGKAIEIFKADIPDVIMDDGFGNEIYTRRECQLQIEKVHRRATAKGEGGGSNLNEDKERERASALGEDGDDAWFHDPDMGAKG